MTPAQSAQAYIADMLFEVCPVCGRQRLKETVAGLSYDNCEHTPEEWAEASVKRAFANAEMLLAAGREQASRLARKGARMPAKPLGQTRIPPPRRP